MKLTHTRRCCPGLTVYKSSCDRQRRDGQVYGMVLESMNSGGGEITQDVSFFR